MIDMFYPKKLLIYLENKKLVNIYFFSLIVGESSFLELLCVLLRSSKFLFEFLLRNIVYLIIPFLFQITKNTLREEILCDCFVLSNRGNIFSWFLYVKVLKSILNGKTKYKNKIHKPTLLTSLSSLLSIIWFATLE